MKAKTLKAGGAMLLSSVIGAIVALTFVDKRADSYESHLVHNYLTDHGTSPELMGRFNAVNNDWPPSRNKLATILLDAQLQVQQRAGK